MKHSLWLAVCALVLGLAAPASATVIFSESFDTSLPSSSLNATIPGWATSAGTVDYIKSGNFGINCLGGVGGCVDLDGSTNSGALFVSDASFGMLAGNTYELTFWLSGNQRGGGSDTVIVSLGTSTLQVTRSPFDPFEQFTLLFTPNSNTSSVISFQHLGGDNVGAILDGVTLTDLGAPGIPEPGTMALLGGALAGLAYLRRRTSR